MPLNPVMAEELRGVRTGIIALLKASQCSEQAFTDSCSSQLRRATVAFASERSRLEKLVNEQQRCADQPGSVSCVASRNHSDRFGGLNATPTFETGVMKYLANETRWDIDQQEIF